MAYFFLVIFTLCIGSDTDKLNMLKQDPQRAKNCNNSVDPTHICTYSYTDIYVLFCKHIFCLSNANQIRLLKPVIEEINPSSKNGAKNAMTAVNL